MTYRNAAEVLKKRLKANRQKYTGELIEALMCAIRLLEKSAERKPAQPTDLTGKCGSCVWFRGPRTTVGVICECPEKNWKSPVSGMKTRTTKACRFCVVGENPYQGNAYFRTGKEE